MLSSPLTKNAVIKFNIVVLIAMFITVLSGTSLLFQNDTFYTIKLGERILNDGFIPIDNFSWHKNLPYTYPHWLYTVIIYKIYEIGGYFGIYISTVIFGFILSLILYFSYINLYKNLFICFLVAIAITFMLSVNFTARAQLLTYILFALEIFSVEKFLKNGKWRYGFFLIMISTLIVNIHCATWLLFFILFLPYFFENLAARFTKVTLFNLNRKIIINKNIYIKKLTLIFIICLFTGLLSPIGDTPYTYLYKTYQGISVYYIMEHQPLIPIKNPYFLIFTGTVIVLCAFTRIRLRLVDICMFAGLVLMSLMSLRQATILYVVCGYFLCRIVTELLKEKQTDTLVYKISTLKGAFLTLVIVCLINLNNMLTLPKEYDTGYPVQATKYIQNNLNSDNSRLYASYEYGSYLLFNNIKVFIDSRADLYTIQFNDSVDIFTDYVDLYYINGHFRDVLAKYSFTHLLLNRDEKLYIILSTDPCYKKIYSDDQFVIYEAVH